eukprot:724539-Amphidinium_carterae.1
MGSLQSRSVVLKTLRTLNRCLGVYIGLLALLFEGVLLTDSAAAKESVDNRLKRMNLAFRLQGPEKAA